MLGEMAERMNRTAASGGRGREEAPRHRLGASGLRWVDVEGLGVRAELGYAERERGSGCGRGGCERRRRRLSGERGRDPGKGVRARESEGERQGGAWRSGEASRASRKESGKQEVAEAASAPVGHARCLLARGRRQEGSPWWAGPASAAGRTGRRQVDLLLSLSYFYLILFFYFL